MSEPLTREQRAAKAHALLNDAVLRESLVLLKEAYLVAMRGCAAKDDLGRYRYAVALDVVDNVARHLESILTLGKLHPRDGQAFQTPNTLQKIARIF